MGFYSEARGSDVSCRGPLLLVQVTAWILWVTCDWLATSCGKDPDKNSKVLG